MADVPGLGWSSPVVWGNRVFLTTVVSDKENVRPRKGLYLGEGVRDPAKGIHHWMVYCFDRDTGAELWSQEAHTGQPKVPRHPKSTYAAETTTTDGERLYALFGDLGLHCYTLSGQPVWSHKIDPKKTAMDYGAAASPVVHDGQVFVVYDNLEESWIAAFDAKTGDVRWKQPRAETHSWATPLVWENELRTEIVVPGKNRNRSYSLRGELLWEFDGKMSNLVIPSPFAAHGLCYIASGYVGDAHRPTFAIRPGAAGDITPKGEQDYADSPYIEWYQRRASPYNTSQIVYGDYLYTLYDQGFLTCHNARTGELVYGKERIQPLASFTSSPWAYNGYLFCLSEDGQTFVMRTGPEFELITSNNLDELCLATPAIADGKLFIRTASKLYCITGGERANEVTADRHSAPASSQPIDIWTAAREGNRDALIQQLDRGMSVNAKEPQEGTTPLNLAVLFGRTETVKLLLAKGADVSIGNPDGNTALHIASFLANPDAVDLLLKNGASVQARNARGETPLDVVSADWTPELEAIYEFVGELTGVNFDLTHLKQARPKVAATLSHHAARLRVESDVSDAWTQLPDMALPRWEAGTVVLDDKLYVFGGYRMPTKSCNRVDVFDPKDASWRQLADLPSAITHMNAVLDGRTVWIAGGFKDGYKGYAIDEVWNYNVDKEKVTAGPPLPEPRAGGGLALIGRRLHYIGGLKPDRDTDAVDHWVLDLNALAKGTAEWKNAAPMADPRNQFGTVTLNGKIYLLGGMHNHDSRQIDQPRVDVYNPHTDTWSRGPDLPAGHSHAEGSTFINGDRIFIVGGMARSGDKRWIDNQVHMLLPGGAWQSFAELPRPLSSPVAAIIGEKLYVGGGSPNGATPQPGMWLRDAP
jgi:N-acetylneuraminic acid mutarotase/outer membrane protein assembly factor BamB